MPTRNINLTSHYDVFVSEQLETGRFQNASEVVRAALSIMEKQNAEDAAKLEALRREVMIGVEQYERGEYIEINSEEELDQLFADIHAEIEAEMKAESQA
jgi:antitoxin ParD1/3/4